jgi:hypothetical protein
MDRESFLRRFHYLMVDAKLFIYKQTHKSKAQKHIQSAVSLFTKKGKIIMKQNKDYIQYELTDEELEAVTGGVNAPAATSVPPCKNLPANAKSIQPVSPTNSIIAAELSLQAFAIDFQAGDMKNAKIDLNLAQTSLTRVQQELK